MRKKVFSKRHPDAEVSLGRRIRQRILFYIRDCDPLYDPQAFNDWSIFYNELPDLMYREHGWTELLGVTDDGLEPVNIEGFILSGAPRFVMDAVEIFYGQLLEHDDGEPRKFQSLINTVFDDASYPWRLVDGRILKVDSEWLETETYSRAQELLSRHGFEGALDEFLRARSDLDSGDPKGAMKKASDAVESTMKSILGIDAEKPGKLIRLLIDSGMVPEYYEEFLKSFEAILYAVIKARNVEKGVGHGQGSNVNEPPQSLAEFTVNLAGVLIGYLLKRYSAQTPEEKTLGEPEIDPFGGDIPF